VKVFFDECVPRPLRGLLAAYEISTAQELGWGRLTNGALIQKAESSEFEVFVTSDKNLKYQQNLQSRTIALLVLSTNYWPTLQQQHDLIISALAVIQPGQYLELTIPAR